MATLIPIKHSDGTIEKITLEEFRARGKKSVVPAVPAEPPKKPTVIPQAPKKIEPPKQIQPKKPVIKTVSPITPPPIKKIESPAPKSSVSFGKEDAKSLLEDEMPAGGTKSKSEDRLAEAKEIVQKSGLKFNTDTEKRLIGLVQLRLKDIRSEDEARDWMMMPENQMGIGLNKEQADKIFKLINERLKKPDVELNVPVLKRPLGTPTALAKEYREPFPAVSTPNNPFIHAPKNISSPGRVIESGDIMPKNNSQARPIMQDITPAKPMNLGPVDEIRFFTLTDFRRLSTNPEEAAARLKQKFINLKEESYLLFINALEAWRGSPLFIDYVNASVEALNAKSKLTERVKNEKISIDEINALIKMEKDLL